MDARPPFCWLKDKVDDERYQREVHQRPREEAKGIDRLPRKQAERSLLCLE
jgi:hypothetical protein